jgi:hypothetical protein
LIETISSISCLLVMLLLRQTFQKNQRSTARFIGPHAAKTLEQ